MLIVAGSFEMEPDRRQEFLDGREEAMRISRGEPGCLEYVFGADPLDPGRVVLYERWADKASLAAHLAAMRERAPDPAPPSVPVIRREIVQYEISAEGPVGS